MRIKKTITSTIIESINYIADDKKYDLYLFGSRTDDNKRGGDIDLLIITDDFTFFSKNSFKIKSSIKKIIGDQKIDIVVTSVNKINTDPFIKSIFTNAIKIN